MDIKELLFCIFNGLLTVYITCFFFGIFATKRDFKFRTLVLCVLSVIFIFSLILLDNSLLSFVFLIFIIIALSRLYNLKWTHCIFLSACVTLIFSFTELIIALCSSYILRVDFATLKTGYYFVAGMLLSKLLTFVIFAIIKLGKHSLPIKNMGLLWGYIGVLPITSFALIFIMVDYIYKIESNPTMQLITSIVFVLLIASNIFIFYVVDKICDRFVTEQKLILANELIESQKKTYRDLYDSQTEIKKIKHDLKNIMIGVLHYINSNEISEAKKYIEQNCELLKGNFNNVASGNSIIDTLISVKSEVAQTVNVKLNTDIVLLNQINIDDIDFSIILGNAIDNAIEATEKTKLHKKEVDISIIAKNSNIVIVVKNPVDKRVDTNNFSTTKSNSEMHGFGILQIMTLVKRYQGETFFDCDDKTFKMTAIINNSNK